MEGSFTNEKCVYIDSTMLECGGNLKEEKLCVPFGVTTWVTVDRTVTEQITTNINFGKGNINRWVGHTISDREIIRA